MTNQFLTYIALGSNVGDSARIIAAAARRIDQLPNTSVERLSKTYISKPAFVLEQPDFYNAVLLAQTSLPPEQLLQELQAIEADFGRVRSDSNYLPNGQRSLDLDIIDYQGEVRDTPELKLPHPGALERDFVVTPLLEIAPDTVLANAKVVNRNAVVHGKVMGVISNSDDESVDDTLHLLDSNSAPTCSTVGLAQKPYSNRSSLMLASAQNSLAGHTTSLTASSLAIAEQSGKLSICATPIGNLADITLRVLAVLQEADVIYAEDTRVTRKLLSYYEIHTTLQRADEHTLQREIPKIIELLQAGRKVAYASDAGMPGISDPGLPLINAVRDAGLTVEVLPGASALPTALVASGFVASNHFFGGFLPRKAGKLTQLLQNLSALDNTMLVFYESVYRTEKSLRIIAKVFPNRKVCMARELTKLHEEILCGPPVEVAQIITDRIAAGRPLKGEVVLVIGPA